MNSEKNKTSGKLLTQLILEIFRLNGRLLAAGDQLTKNTGLTSARWQVLGAINSSEVPLTVPSIARNMGLQRQSVQRIVDVLEAEGLIELYDNPHHKKARLVRLTEQGHTAFDRASKLQTPWVNGLVAGIDVKQLENTLALIRELRGRLEEE